MKRYRAWLSVLGIIGIPTVAAACWPMWGRPAHQPMAYPTPMYVPMCQPAPIYVSPPFYQPAAPTLVVFAATPVAASLLRMAPEAFSAFSRMPGQR